MQSEIACNISDVTCAMCVKPNDIVSQFLQDWAYPMRREMQVGDYRGFEVELFFIIVI